MKDRLVNRFYDKHIEYQRVFNEYSFLINNEFIRTILNDYLNTDLSMREISDKYLGKYYVTQSDISKWVNEYGNYLLKYEKQLSNQNQNEMNFSSSDKSEVEKEKEFICFEVDQFCKMNFDELKKVKEDIEVVEKKFKSIIVNKKDELRNQISSKEVEFKHYDNLLN